MTSPTFDSDGYPTDETLDAIAKWSFDDAVGWLNFIHSAWSHRFGFLQCEMNQIVFATGGWSGNESIIEAMRENVVLWTLLWESSHRGGKYVLRLPEEKR